MVAKPLNPTTRLVDAGTALVVLISAFWTFSSPLRDPGNLMAYAQDDLYYYLVAARNLATGHGSTFDGTTLTNGYHPLYFLIWWAVYHFTSQLTGVFRFLSILDTLSAIGIFLASRTMIARRLRGVWLQNGLALAMLCLCYAKLQHQMEVTLTIPLVLIFLCLLDRSPESISSAEWFGVGILGALMVLSRLDALLLVIMFGVCAITVSSYRRALTGGKVQAFLSGFLPLLIVYVVTNEVFFHRLSPVSGAAKQMRTVPGFAWKALLFFPGSCFTLIVVLITLVVLLVLRDRFSKEQLVVYSAALTFPVIHWLLQLWSSDWGVWPWYTYSLRSAMLMVFLLVGLAVNRIVPERAAPAVGVVLFAMFLWLTVHRKYVVEPGMVEIAETAQAIRDFATSHPGRYAMGDRAGMEGYLNDQPTIQTEGLMMDGTFLDRIWRQDPLREVLKDYHVDYYVGFSHKLTPDWKPVSGCFEAREPAQAGPSSPTLRSEFCERPVWTMIGKTGEMMIFDVRDNGGAAHP